MSTSPHGTGYGGGGEPPGADDALFPVLRDALRPAYLLVRRLGEGGMGAVYLAREPSLKRDVAVKVMLPWLATDATARARFDREAQAVAAITHPNVINIFGTGELPDGTPYFVMQFVPGRSLEARLEGDGPLGLRETRRVLAEVAAALAAAHKRGIIHRDIKAANVLQDAESGRVVVTDFGIAAVREAGDTPHAKLTQPDTGSPGTPFYMAPEQLVGEETTEASDVYAFGLLAYELLTGAGPFRGTSPHEIAAAHLRDTPPPLSQLREDVDGEIEHLVAACLAKIPGDRPSSAQLVQRLPPGDAFSLEWPPPGLEPLVGRLPSLSRRHGLGSGLLAAAVLALTLADPAVSPPVPLWLLEIAALAGGLTLLLAVFATGRALRLARHALRQGYGWLAVMEVGADGRGDTGALITGRRDYAALARATRNRLRGRRLAAAACGFGAAVAPLLMLLVAVRLAAHGTIGPAGATLLVVTPSLLLLGAGLILRLLESRAVRVRRRSPRRSARVPTVARNVVNAWNDSFATASAGQPLGARMPPPLATRLAMRLIVAAAGIGVVVVAPFALVPMLFYAMVSAAVPRFTGTVARTMPAEAGARWAPAPDSSIAATEAGRAFHAIALAGQGARAADLREPQPRLHTVFLPPDTAQVFPVWPWSSQDSLLRVAARHGFTPAQRAYLARIAAHPGWPAFRVAARAPRADIPGTRYTAAALATRGFWTLSLPRFATLKDAGLAATGVAALRLDQGRPAEAEAALRDAVGVGLNLMHNGVFMLETLIGATMANNALDRLATLYEVTGRADEAGRIRAVRDAARERAALQSDVANAAFEGYRDHPLVAYRRELLRLLADSTLPSSFRWEFVPQVALLPCLNTREMVFGQRPDVDDAVATFRRQVVRTPGDSLWLRKAQTDPFARASGGVLAGVASAWAGVLGAPAFGTCLGVFVR